MHVAIPRNFSTDWNMIQQCISGLEYFQYSYCYALTSNTKKLYHNNLKVFINTASLKSLNAYKIENVFYSIVYNHGKL